MLSPERIRYRVSRQLYRAGGYCTSEFTEPPNHEIVVSYPAYLSWGWEKIVDIVHHELAHAATYEVNGQEVDPHGPEFQDVAERIGAPLRGEERLPYSFELYCTACEELVDGLYRPSVRTQSPQHYRSDCCDAPLRVEEQCDGLF